MPVGDYTQSDDRILEGDGSKVTRLQLLSGGGYACSGSGDSPVINSLYATLSGLIVFTKYQRQSTAPQKSLEQPPEIK